MKKYLVLILGSIFLLGALFFYQSTNLNDGKLHLIVCNVGQGDGILIRTPEGLDIIIDGGPNDSILDCLSNHLPFWDRDIELMVMTHPDADHMTGLNFVIQRYNVLHFVANNIPKNTAVFKRLQQDLKVRKIIPKNLYAGDNIQMGNSTSLRTFWPEKSFFDQYASSAGKGKYGTNDFAIVQLLSYGNFKALLTADAGENIEDKIVEDIGKIDVLKFPHHGSKTGMSNLFLERLNPSLAIISVGAHNSYGHPTQVALDLLSTHNIKTLRTDKNGEVEVVTDGKTYKVYSN